MVKNDDGTSTRGYQLATVRTLRDRAGLWSQGALAPIHVPAVAWWRPLLEPAPGVRAGALRLAERGLLDGATFSHVTRKRRVDVIPPLTAHLVATQEALQRAAMAAKGEAHPSRAAPRSAWGHGVEPRWAEGEVPLNAWGIRCWNKKKKGTDPSVLVTTARSLSASWIVRHYEERPESAQDYEQRKSGGWQRQKLRATR